MLKKSASFVLTSLRGSTYRSVRLASSLAAALLNSLFEHPAGLFSCCTAQLSSSQAYVRIVETLAWQHSFPGLAVSQLAAPLSPCHERQSRPGSRRDKYIIVARTIHEYLLRCPILSQQGGCRSDLSRLEEIRQNAWRFLRNGERMGAFSGRGL